MNTPTSLPSDRHWATVPTEELPQVVETLKQRFWQSLEDSGRLFLWRKSERTYYGEDQWGGWKESAAVQFGGLSGEMAYIRMNQYRSIIQAILAMITSERPAFYAKAINSATRSLIEAPIATGIIQFYYNDKRIDDLVQSTAERAMVLGEGYIHNRWDTLAGKAIGKDPMTGAIVHEGDVNPEAVSPLDVVRDTKGHPDRLTWAIVAHRANIWDLAAAYPTVADRILAQRGSAWWPDNVWSDEYQNGKLGAMDDPDRVVVWCVYHLKTDAVPNGRYALLCGDVVLSDEEMKLDEVPVYCCAPSKHMDKKDGNSAMWDLLAPSDAYDSVWSSLLTVHDTYNTYNLFVPKGSGITAKQIASGQRLVEYNVNPNANNRGLPTALPFQTLPTAAYEFKNDIKDELQSISGVNATARGEGDPEDSGTKAALIQSLAVKFQSGPQRAVIWLHERLASGILKMVKLYSKTPKVSAVVGSGGAEYLQTINPEQIETVQRVIVETANPLTQQLAGRLELAEKMAERFPNRMTMEEFGTIALTGELGPLLAPAKALTDEIASENDLLREGKLPPIAYMEQPKPPLPGTGPLPQAGMPPPQPKGRTCHPTDDHAIHIANHKTLMTVVFRADPAKMKALEQHMTDHYEVWSTMPPDLGALTGQSLPPPPPPMSAPPPEDGKPEEKGKPPAQKGDDVKPQPEKARPLGGAPQPNMPSMPRPAGGGPPAPA